MRVDATSYARAVQAILEMAETGGGITCVANVHMVMEAYDDPAFRALVNDAELVTSDGMPLVWTLRALGAARRQRVYGPELMPARLRGGGGARRPGRPLRRQRRRARGADAAARRALPRASHRVRARSAASARSRREEDAQVVDAIRDSGARILFVGLGCPKQERWMAEHRERARLRAGGRRRRLRLPGRTQAPGARVASSAPGSSGCSGWSREPRRLWRRYARHNPRFAALAARQVWRARSGG